MTYTSDKKIISYLALIIGVITVTVLGYIAYIDYDKLKSFFTTEYISFIVAIALVIPFLFLKKGKYFRPVFLLVSIALFGFLQYACPRPTGAIELLLYNNAKGRPFEWHLLIKVGFILGLSLIFAKYYCGWICPKGIIQEYIYYKKLKINIPDRLDKILKSGKYIMLILLIMSPVIFKYKLFREIGPFKVIFNLDGSTYLIIFLVVVLLSSVFIERAYCRYFCPFGALLGILSFFSFNKIRFVDNNNKCKACNLCVKACPTNAITRATKENKTVKINTFECIVCKECLESCPTDLILFGKNKLNNKSTGIDLSKENKTKLQFKGGEIK